MSPSTAARDRTLELDRYRVFGVPEYWVVDPEASSVDVWRLSEGPDARTILGGSENPNWRPVVGNPSLATEVVASPSRRPSGVPWPSVITVAACSSPWRPAVVAVRRLGG